MSTYLGLFHTCTLGNLHHIYFISMQLFHFSVISRTPICRRVLSLYTGYNQCILKSTNTFAEQYWTFLSPIVWEKWYFVYRWERYMSSLQNLVSIRILLKALLIQRLSKEMDWVQILGGTVFFLHNAIACAKGINPPILYLKLWINHKADWIGWVTSLEEKLC